MLWGWESGRSQGKPEAVLLLEQGAGRKVLKDMSVGRDMASKLGRAHSASSRNPIPICSRKKNLNMYVCVHVR